MGNAGRSPRTYTLLTRLGGSLRCALGFKGQQVKAEAIMSRAGLSSDKPSDLFKVRPRDKGKPQYEDQHHAYEVLVECHKREGLYWMPCASPNLASA